MEFAFSEEQSELASTVRQLLGKRADSAAIRATAEGDAPYDPDLWQMLVEQIGAAALAIPEEYDGAGFSLFEALIVLEEVGRSLAPSPLLSSLLAQPDAEWGWPIAGDPLAKLARTVTAWVDVDGGRRADLPGGRLVEHLDEDGRAAERLFEHSERGTLFGSYDEDRLLQLAELWTTAAHPITALRTYPANLAGLAAVFADCGHRAKQLFARLAARRSDQHPIVKPSLSDA